jgi:hypothetical protein
MGLRLSAVTTANETSLMGPVEDFVDGLLLTSWGAQLQD